MDTLSWLNLAACAVSIGMTLRAWWRLGYLPKDNAIALVPLTLLAFGYSLLIGGLIDSLRPWFWSAQLGLLLSPGITAFIRIREAKRPHESN